ncbi:hypothetical protein [Actinoplanes derwentensis]|uniref:Uncharacterized protein n=1 Tax=Actinoplanes derwentensis TaxID=113562 RepID=A0A1H2DB82_9ACTN|nr:hypothetical protein [Actinoplanes derwentensis]GID81786.1 hypothetical protein Ade03nite_07100 [Actinoplanes derwentensis]SDT79847.1 hypothetical protein SAMN04489716_8955 [Actinoplanes derwentensis]
MRQPGGDEAGTEAEGSGLAALGGLELGDLDAGPGGSAGEAGRSGRSARNRNLIVSTLLTALLIACLGTAVHLFLRINEPSAAGRPPPPPPPPPPRPGPSSGGPQPAGQSVRTESDLGQVCADKFYPSAPRYRGSAPHPVLISEGEDAVADSRSTRTLNRAAFAGSATQRRTWAPGPERAQIVACLDLTGPGRKIRDCRTGDGTLPLVEGRYRLSVYEVATRRRLLRTAVTGTDRSCPFVIPSGSGDILHSAVKDQQLYDLLRDRVEG